MIPPLRLSKLSTTLCSDGEQRTVCVTHPFHPWSGRSFLFVEVRQSWGEDRVFFFDDEGVRRSLRRAWTDAGDPDVFVALAAGRSAFRVEDLLVLVELVDGLRGLGEVAGCKEDFAASVKGIPPGGVCEPQAREEQSVDKTSDISTHVGAISSGCSTSGN